MGRNWQAPLARGQALSLGALWAGQASALLATLARVRAAGVWAVDGAQSPLSSLHPQVYGPCTRSH